MMKWAKELFPINKYYWRRIERTIKYIKRNVNNKFKSLSIKSNTKVYDWKIPLEWKITEAYIKEVGVGKFVILKKTIFTYLDTHEILKNF